MFSRWILLKVNDTSPLQVATNQQLNREPAGAGIVCFNPLLDIRGVQESQQPVRPRRLRSFILCLIAKLDFFFPLMQMRLIKCERGAEKYLVNRWAAAGDTICGVVLCRTSRTPHHAITVQGHLHNARFVARVLAC